MKGLEGGCEWRRLAATSILAWRTGSRSGGHSGTDKTLRWLFKQVNWPGHQRERGRWMEAERREIWGQKNVTRGEGWSPEDGDEDDEE